MIEEQDNIQITVYNNDAYPYNEVDAQHLYDPNSVEVEIAVKRALDRSDYDIIFIHLTSHGDKYLMCPRLARLLTNYQTLDEFNVDYTLTEL